ncbi:hypothetical protein M758_7G132600 [Ceratodon purpureus]|nr:hypothetical protein M758_7G132600 [Ceratodon purpureus]
MSGNRVTVQMLEEFDTPHFGKTLTRTMLKRNERVGIPVRFIHEHGDKIHSELSLTGPTGKSWPVICVIRARDSRNPRVYLGQDWLGFARENGFKMGDQVVFRLVARSSFHVHATGENLSPKDDDGAGTSGDAMRLEPPQQLRGVTNPRETQVPSSQFNSNPGESSRRVQIQKPSQRRSSHLPEAEYVRYPGLSAAADSNSRFPHFVKKLAPNHLNGRYMRMELPWAFVKEHGDKFHARVALLGASGHSRIVSLRIVTNSGINRVHLGKGWKEFTVENGFKEGDVLLFSLVELSKFVIQMFPEAGK